jgi:hypothetical protein
MKMLYDYSVDVLSFNKTNHTYFSKLSAMRKKHPIIIAYTAHVVRELGK